MDNFVEYVTRNVEEFLISASSVATDGHGSVPVSPSETGRTRGADGLNPRRPIDQAQVIAERLVRDSYAGGLLLDNVQVRPENLPDGNTAEAVLRLQVSVPFVFKLSGAPKLVEEAALLRRVQERRDLPDAYRARYPKVYALKDDSPPFAYVMQYFDIASDYTGLNHLLVPRPMPKAPKINARRIAHAVADAFMEGFEHSINRRYRPSIAVDYVARIDSRMKEVAAKDRRFRPRPLRIERLNRDLEPWTNYMSRLEELLKTVDSIHPPFATFVHGDPNPENILVSISNTQVDVKFIDPKEWENGDWLFDVTKLTHYLEVTGPAELSEPSDVSVRELDDVLSLGYELEVSDRSGQVVDEIRDRADAFATQHGDAGWERRYELGMAANILGLPINRLGKRPDVALVLYAEGVRWLADCVESLESSLQS